MKHLSKTILLVLVLLVASACSAVFESAGLSAEDATMLSNALAVDPTTATADFDYSFNLNISADGETISITTNGRGITDPANGNSLLTMMGEVAGVPDFGGEALPYDMEIRTINTNDVYIRGIASLIDPSMDPNQWIYLPADMTTQMALSQSPEIGSTGLVQDGQIDATALYGTLNDNFFGTAGNYINAQRLDDMDGMAHYQLDLMVGEWLGSDELSTGLETLIPALAGDAVPADEMEATVMQLGMGLGMVSMFAEGGTYQLDYYVNPMDSTLSQATITIALEIDPAMMGGEGEPVMIDIMLDVNFSEFGPDSVVVAPEEFINPMEG